MAIIIDLIIVAILALSIFLGYKKGLAKNIIKIISFLVAIIIAILFFKPVSNFIIEKTEIDETNLFSVQYLWVSEIMITFAL